MTRRVPVKTPKAGNIDNFLSGTGADIFCQIQNAHVSKLIPTPWKNVASCECDDGFVMLDTHIAGWDDRYHDPEQTMACLKEETVYPMPPQSDQQMMANNGFKRNCREGEIAGDDEFGHWFCGSWGGTVPPPPETVQTKKAGDACGDNATVGASLKCFCNDGFDWANAADPANTNCVPAKAGAPPTTEQPKTVPTTPQFLPQSRPDAPAKLSTGVIVGGALAIVAAFAAGVVVYRQYQQKNKGTLP